MGIGSCGVPDFYKIVGIRIDGGFNLKEFGLELFQVGGIDLVVDLVEDVRNEDGFVLFLELIELRNFLLK